MLELPDEDAEAPDAPPIRVLVVDDHDLFRTGLRRLLEAEGLHVVAAERSGEAAVRVAAQLDPQVVVMDVQMPGMSGIEATRRIVGASPSTAVLMLSISDDEETVLAAVLAGASGYLLKNAGLEEIVRGVRATAAGESALSTEVAAGLLAQLRRHGPLDEPVADDSGLSERELAVMCLVVDGCGNGEIARRLHVSTSTIKHHVASSLVKLGVENRVQAAVLAVRTGLVESQDGRTWVPGRPAMPTDGRAGAADPPADAAT